MSAPTRSAPARTSPSPAPTRVTVDELRSRPSGDTRFVSIRADLMPDEVLVARRVEALRRKIVLALAMLVAIIVAGYGASWLQTRSAESDLGDVRQQNTSLAAQQSRYAPLVKAQAEATAVQNQLGTLMTGDLPWSGMLGTIRAQAPAGVALTGVTGLVSTTVAGAGAAGGAATTGAGLNQSGQQAVGSLTITGTAGNKAAVAAYSDRLNRVTGLTAPLITNVTATDSGVSFSMNLTITTRALGGRFTAHASSPVGGK